MAIREGVRPGGRSARVQASVHQAVKNLLDGMSSEDVTVALVAAEAGVTPSTIYRRWGDLQTLLADVAVDRFHPDGDPGDTGSFRSDLEAWAQNYLEEMSSAPGREMLRDVMAGMSAKDSGPACQCADIVRAHLQMFVDRAHERGEFDVPDMDEMLDVVVAPITFRLLFDAAPVEPAFARRCVARLVERMPEEAARVA
ncbi:TetR/AcrR family transcriptional regulator [Bordetella genomosp. 13]|uniref:TetR/AcrR family transcriptional regulator n=1 Tax=Bordetella genomosp. 13 TaxID=463040 RepID=UPI0011A33794|nr:TetR/AcrR family transcriptional regulator [Bordetella genomosp. 13]